MSGRVKIKSKDKDKKPKIDVFKVIENRFKNMNELRDLIDMDPRKGLVRRRREGGGCPEGWEPARSLGFYDWYIPSCPQMSLIYMRMVDINDILYLIGGKMFQASTEAYMTSSECNDINFWTVSGYGQVGVSDKRNPKRIRLIRDL